MYRAFIKIPGALYLFLKNKKAGWVDEKFLERLQLAVTEVNGCAVCSYAHTKIALSQGMSNEEIASFLSGDGNFIQTEEAKAIAFAQHYADSRGYPTPESYRAIQKEYGDRNASIVLAAIQIMMAANIYGIPMSAFQSRRKGRPYPGSSLFYELNMQITGLIVIMIALLHGLVNKILGKKII